MTTRKELEEKLITRAWQDEAFKQELLTQPNVALAKEGINIPSNVEVRVFEENSSTLYVIIPMNPAAASELSEAELESVAGGGTAKPDWYVTVGK